MNLYQQRVLNARKEFLRLNKKQEKELLSIYRELAKQLSSEIDSCRTSSSKQYLNEMEEIVQVYTNYLKLKLNKTIKNNIKASSHIASSVELAYYNSITNNVRLRTIFNKSVVTTSANTVKKLIQGQYYADGKTLDHRIWNLTKKNAKDIDTLIKVNISRGANSRKLAQQVDKYVNPLKRTEAKTFVSGMNSKVSYQAQRLARTSITHSFRETQIQQAINNPFSIGMKWELSPSHGIRMHGKTDVCDDYAGQDNYGLGVGVFPVNKMPIGHPQCLCITYEINIDIDDAITRLKKWCSGESDKILDKWYDKCAKEYGII